MLYEGEVYYFHTDHLGTPRRMTDSSQVVVWDAIQSPFGALTLLTEEIENPLRFPGQYFDRETGLHYNYFRDYDPSTGRYVESDPIGLKGGLNTYAYVRGNPIGSTDPSGLVEWTGTYAGGGFFVVVGAGAHYFDLVSECINGSRATASVLLVGSGIGGSVGYTTLPANAEQGLVFNDHLRTPDPSVFSGRGGIVTGGVSVAPNSWGVREITLGEARYEPGTGSGATGGLDVGAAVMTGSSSLIDFSFEDCGCEE